MMLVSDFLDNEISPFLLGAFFSRIIQDPETNVFYTYSKFRSSRMNGVGDIPADLAGNLQIIYDRLSVSDDWTIEINTHSVVMLKFSVSNNLNLTRDEFYKRLYRKILSCEWVADPVLNENKKDFIRAFFELRGSVDTNCRYIAQDYFYNNDDFELKKALILADQMSIPMKFLNFNPRELQPQYINGVRQRNAQFRINSFYYAKCIGFVNEYKAKIFERAFNIPNDMKSIEGEKIFYNIELPNSRNDTFFAYYFNFFTNNIYRQSLTPAAIRNLRNRLGFDDILPENQNRRDRNLKELFDAISADECAVCHTTRTYTRPNSNRQHFDIHHVISYWNGQEVDNIANLVKLCPTCHDMLGRGHANRQLQINAITEILNGHPEIREFTSSYLGIDDFDELVDRIWQMLG